MSVEAILAQMGQNARARASGRGSMIADAVGGLASIPGQIMDERAQRAIQQQQLLRLQAQDARGVKADLRADSDQAMQDAAAQRELESQTATRAGIAAGFGDSTNPADFDVDKAAAALVQNGRPDLVERVQEFHTKILPKITQQDPTKDTYENGVLKKRGVAKAPELGTPGYEVYQRSQTLQHPAPLAPGDYGPATPGLPPAQADQQAYDDQRTAIATAAAAAKPAEHSAIYKEWQDSVNNGGKLSFDAYMNADANRRRTTVHVNTGNPSDVKDYVAGMRSGELPPVMPGRASKDYTAIGAEAKRQGFDLAKANTDWAATQKHVATMNGAQQLRLNQAVNALPEMLDNVATLSTKWKGGRFPVLNKTNLALAKGGAYGPDVASVANQLDAQIADVVADLGNVYMGGNSPTDHALQLAGKSLNAEWDSRVLGDMVTLAKKNVTIRQNSIRNTGVAGASDTNPYGNQRDEGAPRPAPAGMMRVVGPNGETGSMPSGNALPPGWKKQ